VRGAAGKNDPETAAEHFRKSLQLAALKSEQTFLSQRLRDCETQLRTEKPLSVAR
jgi:hypothetical protein